MIKGEVSNMESLADVSPIAAIIASVLSVVSMLVYVIKKFSRLELKVDTMWDFLMRRAETELLQKGYGNMNSPITVNAEGMKAIAPIASTLRTYYKKLNREVDDTILAMDIEREFGKILQKEICIPNGFTMGACLILAVYAAKHDIEYKGKKTRIA